MPRRHRSARDREAPAVAVERPVNVAPDWAQAEDVTVRAVSGQAGKTYRCPGCHQEIRQGIPHLVIAVGDDMEGRRHWHTPCWRSELKRRGQRP
jgi:hypothetical protein